MRFFYFQTMSDVRHDEDEMKERRRGEWIEVLLFLKTSVYLFICVTLGRSEAPGA